MPHSLRIDPDSGIAIGTCSGTLRLEDAKAGAAAVWSSPEWNGHAVVWDMREARLDVSTADLRESARFVLERQPAKPPPKVAFVTGTELDFGLARMFEAFREDPATEVRVFRDLDEALAWARSAE